MCALAEEKRNSESGSLFFCKENATMKLIKTKEQGYGKKKDTH